MNLLELASAREDRGFTEWFQMRVRDSELDVGLPEYLPSQLIGQLLGLTLCLHGYWEKNAVKLKYPVPNPARRPLWAGKGLMTRIYTPAEVVAVAYWRYGRIRDGKAKGKGRREG